MKVSFLISQYSNLANTKSITNNPIYWMQNNVVFTAPTDGYARVSAQGVLGILNSNDGSYAAMCVNRYTTGNRITQSLYVRKGTPLKWQADDGSTSIIFWPIVS